MRMHGQDICRDELSGDYCPPCERAAGIAEERKYGMERDDGMSDLLADRYERNELGL